MTKLKMGTIKIKNGLKTIFAPSAKKYWEQYKKSNFAKGSDEIVEGVKHIFGQSKVQLHERLVNSLIESGDKKRQLALKPLVENQISIAKADAAASGGVANNMMTNIAPTLVVSTYNKMITPDLFGVQPIGGPVGLIYLVEHTNKKFEVLKHPVEARTRKLRATWNMEMKQDLAMHGLNFEDELISALSSVISEEIDIEMIHQASAIAKEIKAKTLAGAVDSAKASGINVNWIVMNNADATKLKDEIKTVKGQRYIGTFNDIPIYLSPTIEHVLLGRKGDTDMDSTLIYCPYVMIMSSGVVVNPNTFEPEVSLMTRYGLHQRSGRIDYVKFSLK